jgi:hypothetical protein
MTKKITDCPHKNRKHFGNGMCSICYSRDYYLKNKEQLNRKIAAYKKRKYNTDPVYRKKEQDRTLIAVKKNYKKKMLQDPDWSARKQREYRKTHPDKFNYCMARFYARRLPADMKLKFIEELKSYG